MSEALPPPTDKRVNESPLTGIERVALLAIARRLPGWVTPDRLTGFGVFGAVMVLMGGLLANYAISWLWLSNLGVVFHWLGDSLDGTVARLRKIERPRYGFYLDQVIDTVGNLLIALGEGFIPGVRMDLILTLLAAYQMLAIQVLVRTVIDRKFQVTVGGMGPTELRIGIILLNLIVLIFGAPSVPGLPEWVKLEDVVVGLGAAGLLGLFAWQMKLHLGKLAKEEPPPA
ncbi:MAG: CDP-alcohol phosphatidyltransferase family protein [Sphingomonadales bacterium]|nr:CDP-alcohol phosphatidyltransferase family protein [Sphingomonadales bacterium]MDE2171520.1 CDP-alcohol phosphatidyltransferase family protein [Sphingomonadales bacterium]